jgi:hypothetical protein
MILAIICKARATDRAGVRKDSIGFIEKGELGTIKKGHGRNRKDVKSAYKTFGKQPLESLDPLL